MKKSKVKMILFLAFDIMVVSGYTALLPTFIK